MQGHQAPRTPPPHDEWVIVTLQRTAISRGQPGPGCLPETTPIQTVWSIYTFRPPTEAELDRYWSTIFYVAELVESHVATRDQAVARALEAWTATELSEAYMVRNERLPNALGIEEAGWHVFKLRLAQNRELDDIADEELPAYVYELGSPPFTERKGAMWEAKKRWQGGDGQVGMIVRAEVLEKAELTRRRLQQRGYLPK